jgi:auxin efflux carrier family protein
LLNVWEESSDQDEEDKDDGDQNGHIEAQEDEAVRDSEETSLLPSKLARKRARVTLAAYVRGRKFWKRLPQWAREILNVVLAFVNPPVIGAALGVLVGLVPALHRLFFNTEQEGGYFNAWLTSALENVGELFPALMVVVVGVKLSTSLLKMKKGEPGGEIPIIPLILITLVRFVIWPAISIVIIYFMASKTNLLSDDPILWFAMMLAPTGPPALLLTALADLAGADEDEKMGIAKFLTVS